MGEAPKDVLVTKRITLSMMEAYFNAMPELLGYVKRQMEAGDMDAIMTMNNFKEFVKNERPQLDPCEAVFGFAAMLVKMKDDIVIGDRNPSIELATLCSLYCSENQLGSPADGYGARLNLPTPEAIEKVRADVRQVRAEEAEQREVEENE